MTSRSGAGTTPVWKEQSRHFYFFGGDATDWIDRTVRVATVNALTLDVGSGDAFGDPGVPLGTPFRHVLAEQETKAT